MANGYILNTIYSFVFTPLHGKRQTNKENKH